MDMQKAQLEAAKRFAEALALLGKKA